jgi:hypothetical protein
MSKECPSCHRDVGIILQCRNKQCRTMFCMYCGDTLGIIVPILLLDQEASVSCSSCGSHGDIISRASDDSDYDVSADEDDTSYGSSSSDYDSYSTSDTPPMSGWGCIGGIVIAGLVIATIMSEKNQYRRNVPVNPTIPVGQYQNPPAAPPVISSSPTDQILDAIHRVQPDWVLVNDALSRGGDPNAADKVNTEGTTPLIEATITDNPDEVQYLLVHGAEIDRPDNFGRTPMFHAIARGFFDIAKFLIEQGANVNAVVTLPTEGDANEPPESVLDYVQSQLANCGTNEADCVQWQQISQDLSEHGAKSLSAFSAPSSNTP